MSYYPDKNQIPTGFEEWSFTNMPEDGEIVEVLSYGKVETMRFDKPYMAFNPPAVTRLGRSEERRVGKECRSRWSPYH